jgi:hypothetical protein
MMTDEELDAALRAMSRFDDAQVDAFDLGSSESELMEDVMSTSVLEPAQANERNQVVSLRRPRRKRRLVLAGVAIAAASVLVVGGTSLLHSNGTSAYAAEAVKVAEANERLLITLPGWKVIRADEFTVTQGEMTFSDGQHELGVFWRDTKDYQSYLNDRADQTKQVSTKVRGRNAITFIHEGSSDLTTIVEPLGANFLEIRADLGSEQAYRDVMASLAPVSVDTWLASLPASVVKPGDRSAVVQGMLQGLPVPAGFDPASMKTKAAVSDRYQLGAQVAGAVACAWFDQWFSASDRGDTTAQRNALDALNTSPTWPILNEMASQGSFGQGIPRLANAIATGSLDEGPGPHKPTRNEIGLDMGCSWAVDPNGDQPR